MLKVNSKSDLFDNLAKYFFFLVLFTICQVGEIE